MQTPIELLVLQYFGFVLLVMVLSQVILNQQYFTLFGMKSLVIGLIIMLITMAVRHWYMNRKPVQ